MKRPAKKAKGITSRSIKVRLRYFLLLLTGLLILSAVIIPHLIPEPEREGKVIVMNFRELAQDWDEETKRFNSVKVGDIVEIHDLIVDVRIKENETTYSFNGALVLINKNMGSRFRIYDEIVIILTLMEYEDVQYGYNFHWFKEDLDGPRGDLVISNKNIYHREDFDASSRS
ncbi:MAG: hypothetical protein JSV49_04255 [Thermoplasmata archaeon]|nr:MAG: hypothetical protein JSV49_04255 [Thermoplasmata archaeon]